MDEILSLKKFIERYKIHRAMAIGFKSHLRIEDDTRLPLGDFIKGYYECWGVQLQSDNVILSDDVETRLIASLPVEGNPFDVGTGRDQSLPVENNANYKKEKK